VFGCYLQTRVGATLVSASQTHSRHERTGTDGGKLADGWLTGAGRRGVMDVDDKADMFAILGLAGAGAALMLVGSLDLMGIVLVLAIVVPALAAVLAATIVAIRAWYVARCRHDSQRVAGPTGIASRAEGIARRAGKTAPRSRMESL